MENEKLPPSGDTEAKHKAFEQKLHLLSNYKIKQLVDEVGSNLNVQRALADPDRDRAISTLLRIARNRGLV